MAIIEKIKLPDGTYLDLRDARINGLIPAQASSENQLADKNFVNSSIATSTAAFQGTYNLVSDLGLTTSATEQQIAAAIATKLAALSIVPDNEDYVFVQIPTTDADPTEIARVDRYKYNGTAWAYEWSLNNSSFTAAQWAALNSGITALAVEKLGALPNRQELTQELAAVDNVFWATYNSTTATEITNAVSAGKVVMCLSNNTLYNYSWQDNSVIVLTCAAWDPAIAYIQINKNTGVWSNAKVGVQRAADRVYSWSGTPSNGKYPSEKLVYDSIAPHANAVETTWSALKALRDGGTLVPGRWYRITDYTCTTTQANTQSAGHVFDILVLATSASTLSEEARAIQHAGDSYFSGSNLQAWKIWYCLDNDSTRFAWADSNVYMNMPPGIQYKRTSNYMSGAAHPYVWAKTSDYEWITSPVYTDEEYPSNFSDIYDGSGSGAESIGIALGLTYGKGVIYRMIDEFDNDVPYDFKNIQVKAYGDTDNVWRYTFDSGDESGNTDESLNLLSVETYYNTITMFRNVTPGVSRSIPLIVFKGNAYSNSFGCDCFYITFGSNCHNNIFGDYCSRNTFGDNCNYNTFQGNFTHSTFGNYCIGNTFYKSCSYITFGTSSSVKSYCRNIIVESGNQHIYLSPTGTTSSSQPYRNVTIAQGVNNTQTYKTIEDSNVGQTFQTIYQPANTQIFNV